MCSMSGICQDNMSALPNCLARVTRRIAVVGEDTKAVIEPLGEVVQFGQLVLGQSFGWEQVKGPGVRILQHRIQHRQVVQQRFCPMPSA